MGAPGFPTPGAALCLERLTVGYRGWRRTTPVLTDVSAAVFPGQLVGLVGRNGAGKSTVLRSLLGVQPCLSGRVWLGGEELTAMGATAVARRMAAVLTDRVEVGRLRAADVVALGRHPHTSAWGRLDDADQAIVAEALAAVGATHLAEADVAELSDGQRQRVLIARALAQEPQVMVLDEPTAFVDPPTSVALLHLLRDVCAARAMAAIVSSHDVSLLLRYADVLWVVGDGPGLRVGGPAELVRDGTVGRAFATPGVTFDAATGGFRIAAP